MCRYEEHRERISLNALWNKWINYAARVLEAEERDVGRNFEEQSNIFQIDEKFQP